MNNENVTMEEVVETIDNTEVEVYEPEESGGLLKVVGILGVCGAVGAAAVHFTKKKREEWTIRQLEKKGYKVSRPEVVDNDEDFEEAEYVESETNEENEK